MVTQQSSDGERETLEGTGGPRRVGQGRWPMGQCPRAAVAKHHELVAESGRNLVSWFQEPEVQNQSVGRAPLPRKLLGRSLLPLPASGSSSVTWLGAASLISTCLPEFPFLNKDTIYILDWWPLLLKYDLISTLLITSAVTLFPNEATF